MPIITAVHWNGNIWCQWRCQWAHRNGRTFPPLLGNKIQNIFRNNFISCKVVLLSSCKKHLRAVIEWVHCKHKKRKEKCIHLAWLKVHLRPAKFVVAFFFLFFLAFRSLLLVHGILCATTFRASHEAPCRAQMKIMIRLMMNHLDRLLALFSGRSVYVCVCACVRNRRCRLRWRWRRQRKNV